MIEKEHFVLPLLGEYEWDWQKGDMVFMLDEEGMIQYSSDVSSILGYESIIGKHMLNLVHPLDREYVKQAAIRSVIEKHPVINKKEIRCKDGNYVVFRSLIVPLIDNGEVYGRMIIARKRAVDIRPFRLNRNLIEQIYMKKVI